MSAQAAMALVGDKSTRQDVINGSKSIIFYFLGFIIVLAIIISLSVVLGGSSQGFTPSKSFSNVKQTLSQKLNNIKFYSRKLWNNNY